MSHGSLPLAALGKEGDLQQQSNGDRTVGEFENRQTALQPADPLALLRDPFAHLPPLLLDPLAHFPPLLLDPLAQAMLHLRDPRQQFFFERPQILFHDHVPGHGNRRGRSPRACLRRARFHQRAVNFGNHDARRFSSRPIRLPKPAPRL